MINFKSSFIVYFSLAFIQIAFGKTNSINEVDTVLIQDNITLGTHAPIGWWLDKKASESMGVCAMYILESKNFDNSPAIIYPRIASSDYIGEKGVDKQIEESTKMLKTASKTLMNISENDFKNKADLKFKIRKFMNGPRPNSFEKIAYLVFKNRVFLAVYSAQNEEDFNKHEKKFTEFLDNISPYSTNMASLSGNCLYPVKK